MGKLRLDVCAEIKSVQDGYFYPTLHRALIRPVLQVGPPGLPTVRFVGRNLNARVLGIVRTYK